MSLDHVTDGTGVHRIDVHDEMALRAWYDTMRAGAVEGRTAPLVVAYESLCASLRNPNPHQRRIPYAAFDAGTLVGTLMIELPQRENTHLAELDITVPTTYRGRGHGTALLAHAERLAADAGRTTLIGEAYVPSDHSADNWPGTRFAHRHGFRTEHREDHLVLTLPASAFPGDTPAEGYHLVSWRGQCPAEYLDAYAAMRTRMERDLPTGDLDVEPARWDAERIRTTERRRMQQGYAAITGAARHTDGTFAGYSELLVPEYDPGEVYQEDTLVMPDHRGHRLGAALKARNLAILADRFPDRSRVHTWTAGVNGAMRHINAAFGFRPVETLHELQRRTSR